jgi:hypothetical protein
VTDRDGDAEDAKSFINMLVDAGALRLDPSANRKELEQELAELLKGRPDAEALSEWLLERDEVDELFADDDQLEKLLNAW